MVGRRALAVLAIGALGAACSLLTNLGDLGADAASDVAADTTTSCSCVPQAPSGWSGPFWIYDGNPAQAPVSCPSVTPSVVMQGHAGLLDASVACTLGCDAASPLTCTGTATIFGGNSCATGGSSGPFEAGCTFVPGGFSVKLVSATVTTSCTTTAEVAEAGVTSATWSTDMIGCSTDAAGSCTDSTQVCLPAAPLPFEAKPCVFQMGAVSCPGAPYSVARPELYTGIAGACAPASTCRCTWSELDCGILVDYVGDSSTCSPLDTSLGANQCLTSMGGYAHISLTPPPASCSPTGMGDAACTPVGTATPTTPFTVCCMP